MHGGVSANSQNIANDEKSACLHAGCSAVFRTQEELRSHLLGNTPGLVEEFNFLRQTVLKFTDVVLNWDSYSDDDKVIQLSSSVHSTHPIC